MELTGYVDLDYWSERLADEDWETSPDAYGSADAPQD